MVFDIFHLKLYSYPGIEHSAFYRTPDQGWFEIPAPWMGGIINRSLLLETSQILASNIDAPMAEPSGNLGAHLLETVESRRPRRRSICQKIRIRIPSTTIQLHRGVKLPQRQRGLVGSGEKCLVLAGQRLLLQLFLYAVSTFHIVQTISCCDLRPFSKG